jgi:erythromycin esterase-like protein
MVTSTVFALALLSQDAEVVAEIKSLAVPLKTVVAGSGLDDLVALDSSLEGVEIVGMGEPTHGSREVFQFKHRMFEYLVERHGYTVFALESSMPDSIAMDRYVLYGEGSAEKAVEAQGFWTWSTQEVVALIEWMREYNRDPLHANKLRVVGVDMQSQVGATLYFQRIFKELGIDGVDTTFWESVSWGVPSQDQMKRVADLVSQHAPTVREKKGDEEARLFLRIGEVFRQAVDDGRIMAFRELQARAVPHMQETFSKVSKLKSEATGLSSDAGLGLTFLIDHRQKLVDPKEVDPVAFAVYAKALRLHAQKKPEDADTFVRAAEILEFLAAVPGIEGLNVAAHRDSKMAENLLWTRDTYFPGEKVMVWAHNYHVSRMQSLGKSAMMGAFLDGRLGAKYLPVGFAFFEGSFQAIGQGKPLQEWTVGMAKEDSLDALLHRVGIPQFFVDLNRLSGKAAAWARRPQTTRNYGAVNNPDFAEAYYGTVVPRQMYGAIVFIAKTTRARPIGPRG